MIPTIDDAWQGTVQFYELVFGTWLIYAFLVQMWERGLGEVLEEWRYVLITFLGASFYWVNHYFQHAPFYFILLNGYAALFVVIYYVMAVRGHARSVFWRICAGLSAVLFTVVYILCEQLARFAVNKLGIQEFWVMLVAYFGFLALIVWRGRASRKAVFPR